MFDTPVWLCQWSPKELGGHVGHHSGHGIWDLVVGGSWSDGWIVSQGEETKTSVRSHPTFLWMENVFTNT